MSSEFVWRASAAKTNWRTVWGRLSRGSSTTKMWPAIYVVLLACWWGPGKHLACLEGRHDAINSIASSTSARWLRVAYLHRVSSGSKADALKRAPRHSQSSCWPVRATRLLHSGLTRGEEICSAGLGHVGKREQMAAKQQALVKGLPFPKEQGGPDTRPQSPTRMIIHF